jgi:peptidoglycan/LPS O-acetylase OafA/YrhL
MPVIAPSKPIKKDYSTTAYVKHELVALTSIRFFATALIVWVHAGPMLGASSVPGENMWGLAQCLTVFFVLSGFLLFYTYEDRCVSSSEKLKFFTARFARVWPSFALANAFFMLFVPKTTWQAVDGGALWWQFALKSTGLQTWVPPDMRLLSVNPPSWSISVDCFFYLLFPLLLANWQNTWKFKVIGSFMLVLFCCALGYLHGPELLMFGAAPVYHWLISVNPCARLFEFVLGMVAAYAFLNHSSAHQVDFRRATTWQIVTIALALLSIWSGSWMASHYYRWHGALYAPLAYWYVYTGGAVTYAVLLFSLAFRPGLVSDFLSHRTLEYLGRLSYAIFLLHWPIMMCFYENLTKPAKVEPHACFILFCFAVIIASIGMYEFVEVPARKFLLRVFNRLTAVRKASTVLSTLQS